MLFAPSDTRRVGAYDSGIFFNNENERDLIESDGWLDAIGIIAKTSLDRPSFVICPFTARPSDAELY